MGEHDEGEWSGDEDEAKKEPEEKIDESDTVTEAARSYLDNLYERAEQEAIEDSQMEDEETPAAYGTIPVDADPNLNEMDSDMFASLYLEELMTMFTDDSIAPGGNEVPAP